MHLSGTFKKRMGPFLQGCLFLQSQHLKSTPADYFWWRFKSGEDREGLEKVTRKVTAAEAAQKDADIKAVRSCLTEPVQ